MAIVVSQTNLIDMPAGWWPTLGGPSGALTLYDRYTYDYATIYRTQPNVRTCVEFLARNIAQLGLHVFRRVSDTDRVRLVDHPLAQVLKRPLPAEYKITRYRLIEALVADLAVYANAYWLKLRIGPHPPAPSPVRTGEGGTEGEGETAGLLRVPPWMVTVYGKLMPSRYEVAFGEGPPKAFTPDQVVHFRGYNPESVAIGVSPLETLRRILAEEHAAGDYREHFWQNAARMHGVILRPAGAPEWNSTARARFKGEFEALYAGGENSGRTAILEEGMTWQTAEFNAQESEYLAGRKLTREECARAYHIPPPLVGILDHATFSNIKEQHKSLYTDVLGPWMAQIEQDLELQLLPEFEDTDGVYVEFNIAEKLQGDFEEQTRSLQSAVGRPWMTANEARGVMNLPHLEGDADELVTPLNVLTGGQASPRDGKALTPRPPLPSEQERGGEARTPGSSSVGTGEGKKQRVAEVEGALRERYTAKWAEVLGRHYRRQEAALLSAAGGKAAKATLVDGSWFDQERWDRELGADLLKLGLLTAGTWAALIKAVYGLEYDDEALEAGMVPWMEEHSRIQATYINDATRRSLDAALQDPQYEAPADAIKRVFALAVSAWVGRQAATAVTSAANFGSAEGARAGGLRTKTWHAGANPRPSHAAQDGVTVGIRDVFPNGLRWPGDPRGDAEDNANCNCTMTYGR